MKTFKTMVFKDKSDKALGSYAAFVPGMFRDFGGTEVPELITMEATIEGLQDMYPEHDFSIIELITVSVEKIEE